MNTIFFPGNPGTPDDFEALGQQLGLKKSSCLNYQYSTKHIDDVLSGSDMSQLSASAEAQIWIAYSWGCYFALYLMTKGIKPRQLILISPYITPSNPMAKWLGQAVGFPFIGAILGKLIANSKTDSFIADSAAPARLSESAALELSSRYKNPNIWKRAILLKEIQTNRDALDLNAVKIASKVLVIFGEQDKFKREQVDAIKASSSFAKNISIVNIPNAGHALIWTHVNELSHAIKMHGIGDN
jgi:pimeloyl-ACP methyl ester carboxylesterase